MKIKEDNRQMKINETIPEDGVGDSNEVYVEAFLSPNVASGPFVFISQLEGKEEAIVALSGPQVRELRAILDRIIKDADASR